MEALNKDGCRSGLTLIQKDTLDHSQQISLLVCVAGNPRRQQTVRQYLGRESGDQLFVALAHGRIRELGALIRFVTPTNHSNHCFCAEGK